MILICFGTRPEWLKIKPLLKKFKRKEYKLLFTGQHLDLIKDVVVDYEIKIDNTLNRLNAVISACLLQFPNEEFEYVLVQGDTASAFACALAAYNKKIKILYVEAGLRTYDLKNPYPEEGYRQMISRIADINYCPTTLSYSNLKNEKVFGKKIIVGNTGLDNLVKYSKKLSYSNKILVTLHRRENHDSIKEWFRQIESLATKYRQYDFILPLHPNPNVQKHSDILEVVKKINPLEHDVLLKLLKDVKLVITDSGGIQEEASFLNKKTIVCRKTTERPEGLDSGHLYLCESPKKLEKIFEKLIFNYKIKKRCPFGDGTAAQKIIKTLTK